ncbi:hypothetical protein CAPTEDRAFT_167710 [Capitella teleta]|uniref:procollagen-proline 4-dioxygenase n=1 Tax=Capitella teleta TaxID=283909 RepID=R7UDE4_CAPTE|nr:hypothetical protein CAPTEDRAFT_167710 [Capitella teleta]|eukprot:ELU04126.1 hypothetical protein CAPTEDRAFT_167710 [Capitella teleta]
MWTSVVLIIALVAGRVASDKFTALVELENILQQERTLAERLQEYIRVEEQRLDQLRDIAASMQEDNQRMSSDPVAHLGNPVNAFKFVKKLSVEWKEILNTLVLSNHSENFCRDVNDITQHFPSEDEDYPGTVTAMLRLQDTYALNPNDMAKGKLPGVKVPAVMSAHDCFEVGRVSYFEGDYYHAVQWMQLALEHYQDEKEKTISQAEALDYLSYSTYMQGNLYHARNLTEQWLQLEPEHSRAQSNLAHFEQAIKEKEEALAEESRIRVEREAFRNGRFEHDPDAYHATEFFQTYEALCRGEDVIPIKDAHKLTCQYRVWHPMFTINPLREETMNFDPWIAVYHQLMSDKDIDDIKALATPRLARATVVNSVTGELEFAKYRISKSGWLKDEEHPTVAKISNRCSALTNLSLSTVEELQIANYGIGGHYEPHFDYSRLAEVTSFDHWRGNRILTVIFYLSDVEAGGGTVFMTAGTKLRPEKGAAAVWYNLHPDGTGDDETKHAACPVLTGNKWVANKWFHERGQEFTRPCGQSPNS